MSKLKILLISAAFIAAFIPAAVSAKTIEVHVNGMVCAFCGQGITKKLSARPEVKKVDVSLKDKIVKIDLAENKDLNDAEIEKILKDSGYQVEKIERD